MLNISICGIYLRNIIITLVPPIPYLKKRQSVVFHPKKEMRLYLFVEHSLGIPTTSSLAIQQNKGCDWREQHTTVPDLVLVEPPRPPSPAPPSVQTPGGILVCWQVKSVTPQQASHSDCSRRRQTRLIVDSSSCAAVFPDGGRIDLSPSLVRAPVAGEGVGCSWACTYLGLLCLFLVTVYLLCLISLSLSTAVEGIVI